MPHPVPTTPRPPSAALPKREVPRPVSPGAVRLLAAASLALGSCDSPLATTGPPVTDPDPAAPLFSCEITENSLFNGGPGPDGIPALVNPTLVPITAPEAAYLDEYAAIAGTEEAPVPRVVGLVVDSVSVAIPHNVLWWHEIVNVDLGGRRLTVSYCPLTGSALVFDATEAGTRRFGVSGLIFQNNLVMFDEETGSLWPQMCRSSRSGIRDGTELVQVPAIEMTWREWKARHPNSVTLSGETGFTRDYRRFPYAGYETNEFLLFALPRALDTRRAMKERVLGVLAGDRATALPFDELRRAGDLAAVRIIEDELELLVLWDARAQAASVYFPRTTLDEPVDITAIRNRLVARDGSEWDVEGLAVSGPMAGRRLEPYVDAYVAFWFAWTSFHPQTGIWTSE